MPWTHRQQRPAGSGRPAKTLPSPSFQHAPPHHLSPSHLDRSRLDQGRGRPRTDAALQGRIGQRWIGRCLPAQSRVDQHAPRGVGGHLRLLRGPRWRLSSSLARPPDPALAEQQRAASMAMHAVFLDDNSPALGNFGSSNRACQGSPLPLALRNSCALMVSPQIIAPIGTPRFGQTIFMQAGSAGRTLVLSSAVGYMVPGSRPPCAGRYWLGTVGIQRSKLLALPGMRATRRDQAPRSGC